MVHTQPGPTDLSQPKQVEEGEREPQISKQDEAVHGEVNQGDVSQGEVVQGELKPDEIGPTTEEQVPVAVGESLLQVAPPVPTVEPDLVADSDTAVRTFTSALSSIRHMLNNHYRPIRLTRTVSFRIPRPSSPPFITHSKNTVMIITAKVAPFFLSTKRSRNASTFSTISGP